MIRLEKFTTQDHAQLIAWIDSAEMLMQFGGPAFQFPLTTTQLEKSEQDKNRLSYKVIANDNGKAIGHAEIYLKPDVALFARILVGEPIMRGKGVGAAIIEQLSIIAVNEFHRQKAKLFVFDWNKAAIRCYEKAGFVLNETEFVERLVNEKRWKAVMMEKILS